MNNNLKYWLAINKIPNLGPVTIGKMWKHFGSIDKVWQSDPSAILQIEDINRSAVKAFLENRAKIDLEKGLEEILQMNLKVLTLEDEDYPAALKNIYDPPPVLYIKGELLKSDEKALAIVGTRKASHYGLECAKKLAAELASLGITIVSGLASGIDTAAHSGALFVKGRTLAILGSGVDTIFPRENTKLAGEIELSGALISEFAPATKIEKGNFPRRNRIISGLSLGVIMVEGHYDSGAMITAKQALDQGREVFAVPGPVGLDQSKGPHWLIKQGAKLVECVEDVLEELNIQMSNVQLPMSNECLPAADYSKLNTEEKKIVAVLSREPKHIDAIAFETGFSIPQTLSLLMMLEIKRLVTQAPGKRFLLGK